MFLPIEFSNAVRRTAMLSIDGSRLLPLADATPAFAPCEKLVSYAAIVRFCVYKARHWRVPPNWTPPEWANELSAHAAAAAHEAGCQYDPSRSSASGTFIISRVMARLLTRYRQEWTFARHLGHSPLDSECQTYGHVTYQDPHACNSVALPEDVDAAIDGLPETDRWLLSQIFWYGRGQTDLARELGVSQPAISKRYRKIIFHLRSSVNQTFALA
jgi:DNA-directed RNA polymerase specialized sigma24 family protein